MQEETDGRAFTEGIGLTFIEKVLLNPLHPLLKGVTVILLSSGILEMFVAVKGKIFPVPDVDVRPMFILSFVQL